MVKCTVRNAATAMSRLRFFNGAQGGYVLLAGGRQVVDNPAPYLFKLRSAGTKAHPTRPIFTVRSIAPECDVNICFHQGRRKRCSPRSEPS
jgi:hypothetical protein